MHTQPMRRIFYLTPSNSHAVSEFDSTRSVGDGESKIRVSSLSAAAAALLNAAAVVHLVHPLCDQFDCGVGWTECSVEAFFEGEGLQIPHHLHQDVTNVHLLFQQTVVIYFCTSPAYLLVCWLRTVFIVQPLVQCASQPLSFLSTTTEAVYQTKHTFRYRTHLEVAWANWTYNAGSLGTRQISKCREKQEKTLQTPTNFTFKVADYKQTIRQVSQEHWCYRSIKNLSNHRTTIAVLCLREKGRVRLGWKFVPELQLKVPTTLMEHANPSCIPPPQIPPILAT